MQGVHNLQDLKAKLIAAGFEVSNSVGYSISSVHGDWGMVLGTVYLNGNPIKNLSDAPTPITVKKTTKKKSTKARKSTKSKAKSRKKYNGRRR